MVQWTNELRSVTDKWKFSSFYRQSWFGCNLLPNFRVIELMEAPLFLILYLLRLTEIFQCRSRVRIKWIEKTEINCKFLSLKTCEIIKRIILKKSIELLKSIRFFKTVFARSSFYKNKLLSPNFSKLAPSDISWRTLFSSSEKHCLNGLMDFLQ